jgi:hypothetical protein
MRRGRGGEEREEGEGRVHDEEGAEVGGKGKEEENK